MDRERTAYERIIDRHHEYLAHYRTLVSFHPLGDVLADLMYEEGFGRIVMLEYDRPWLYAAVRPLGVG